MNKIIQYTMLTLGVVLALLAIFAIVNGCWWHIFTLVVALALIAVEAPKKHTK